jgi:hypothetical protein
VNLIDYSDRNVVRVGIGLTVVKQSFLNVIRRETEKEGVTCIGCGVALSHQHFTENGRPNAAKVMIVVASNHTSDPDKYDPSKNPSAKCFSSFSGIVSSAKNAGIAIFGIGVGPALQSEINQLSSSIMGVQTAFFTPDFSQLSGITNALAISTCIGTNMMTSKYLTRIFTDAPGNPCGDGCRGFCSCGATCVCPDACDDSKLCTPGTCVEGQGGNGCVYKGKDCSDGDFCTDDLCDDTLGCVHTPVLCAGGCVNNSCIAGGCDPASCDDNHPCSIEYCEPLNGGCFNTFPNSTTYCNDNNVCTIDTCRQQDGCIHTPIICDDGDACTDDTCNSFIGCQHFIKDCGEDPQIKALIGDCYVALCSNERGGCYLEQLPGTQVDECGVCNGNGSSCSKHFPLCQFQVSLFICFQTDVF